MSADNYVYIEKLKKGYKVWWCTASCVCNHKKHCLECQKTSLIKKCKTLDEAWKIAGENDSQYCEYGITPNLWCK
jgi:hypothetical protein